MATASLFIRGVHREGAEGICAEHLHPLAGLGFDRDAADDAMAEGSEQRAIGKQMQCAVALMREQSRSILFRIELAMDGQVIGFECIVEISPRADLCRRSAA